jgi:hypothetical protein
VVLVLVALATESLLGVGQRFEQPVSVSYSVAVGPSGNTTVTISIQNRGPSLVEQATVIPERPGLHLPDHLYFLVDPALPSFYASRTDVTFAMIRAQHFLSQMGSPIPVSAVSANDVGTMLRVDPHAALAIIGTPAPASILTRGSSPLSKWVRDGGTLYWAGGPLGYSAGTASPGQPFSYANLFWQGQIGLVGFSLTDPAVIGPSSTVVPTPPPPLYGSRPSVLASQLGTLYHGTPDGANVTRLLAHGGFDLGQDSIPAPGTQSGQRTSLAFVPVGAGCVYFFGGADYSGYAGYVPVASGWVAGGTVEISEDIALLSGLGLATPLGRLASANVTVGAWSSASTQLTLPAYAGPVTVLVRSETVGVIFSFWSNAFGDPTTPAGSATAMARPSGSSPRLR